MGACCPWRDGPVLPLGQRTADAATLGHVALLVGFSVVGLALAFYNFRKALVT